MMYDLEETEQERPAATRSLAETIWRRKWYWIGSVGLCVALASVYSQYATPIYEANAQLLLQELRSPDDQSRPTAHGVDFSATQAGILGSPVMFRAALDRAPAPYPGFNPNDLAQLVVLMESLSVEKIPQTDIIGVRFRNDNKDFALKLVISLLDEYQKQLKRQQQLLHEGEVKAADIVKLQQQLWEAQGQEKELSQRYGPRHPELRAVQEKIAIWTKLLGDRTTTMRPAAKTPDDLMEKLGGVKIAVLNAPKLSDGPVWPSALILYPAAVVLGLLLGFGLVAILESVDDTLRSSVDTESRLGMRVCGQIPTIPACEGHPFRTYRCVMQSPGSSVAKAFRALARELVNHGANGSNGASGHGRIIQLTSAEDGAGKTGVAANLAVSLARSGVKVVLVDADLRRGTLHRVFDVSPAQGLTAVMLNGTDVDDLLQTSNLARVDVLSKGPAVRNPLHLLAQPEVEKVLETLRGHYDVVLVDTPSLLSLSDASLLAPCADIVLVVLRAGKSTASNVRRALDMLDSVGTKMVGTVLNRVQPMRWAADVDEKQAVLPQEPAPTASIASSN